MLGPMVVLRAGEPLSVGRSKLRDLLALLTAHSPDVVSADGIVDELWRGTAPPSARKVVQKHVSELRQLLGRPHIVSLAGGYALRDVSIDSAMFDTAFEQSRSDEPRVRCERLTEALAMWRGEPYADVDLDGLEPVRARLDELRLAAIEQLNEARLSTRRVDATDRRSGTADHRASAPRRPVEPADARARTPPAARATRCGPSNDCERSSRENSGSSPQASCANSSSGSSPRTRSSVPRSTGVVEVDPEGAHRRVMTIIAVALDDPAGDDPEDRARSTKAVHEQIRRMVRQRPTARSRARWAPAC